jgi:hypothetical protein
MFYYQAIESITKSQQSRTEKREKNWKILEPRNLFQKLLLASIESTPVKCSENNNFLEVNSQLGSVLSIPEVHPLSPLQRTKKIYNEKPLVKILDAPGLEDDYYLNILDWSNRDCLAIALRDTVHWCRYNKDHIKETGAWQLNDLITSVMWLNEQEAMIIGCKSGNIFKVVPNAKGDSNNRIQAKLVDQRKGRVGVVDLHQNMMVIGGRDRQAIVYDHINLKKIVEFSLCGHHQEICGLKFSPDGTKVATGGNDNLLCIWDFRNPSEPIAKYHEHSAAIKALSWISANKLVSGGGTADRNLKLWDTSMSKSNDSECSSSSIFSLQTSSQITKIVLSDKVPGLIYASHGFSDNSISTYRITNDRIQIVDELQMTGHTQRVLWLTKRPANLGEELLASASGDETIRVWKPLAGGDCSSEPERRSSKRQRSFNLIKSEDLENYNVFL